MSNLGVNYFPNILNGQIRTQALYIACSDTLQYARISPGGLTGTIRLDQIAPYISSDSHFTTINVDTINSSQINTYNLGLTGSINQNDLHQYGDGNDNNPLWDLLKKGGEELFGVIGQQYAGAGLTIMKTGAALLMLQGATNIASNIAAIVAALKADPARIHSLFVNPLAGKLSNIDFERYDDTHFNATTPALYASDVRVYNEMQEDTHNSLYSLQLKNYSNFSTDALYCSDNNSINASVPTSNRLYCQNNKLWFNGSIVSATDQGVEFSYATDGVPSYYSYIPQADYNLQYKLTSSSDYNLLCPVLAVSTNIQSPKINLISTGQTGYIGDNSFNNSSGQLYFNGTQVALNPDPNSTFESSKAYYIDMSSGGDFRFADKNIRYLSYITIANAQNASQHVYMYLGGASNNVINNKSGQLFSFRNLSPHLVRLSSLDSTYSGSSIFFYTLSQTITTEYQLHAGDEVFFAYDDNTGCYRELENTTYLLTRANTWDLAQTYTTQAVFNGGAQATIINPVSSVLSLGQTGTTTLNLCNNSNTSTINVGGNSNSVTNVTGNINLGAGKVQTTYNAFYGSDVVNKNYTDSTYVSKSGSTITGQLVINNSSGACLVTNQSHNPIQINYSDVNSSNYITYTTNSTTGYIGIDGVGLFNSKPNTMVVSNAQDLGVSIGSHTGGAYTETLSVKKNNVTMSGTVQVTGSGLLCDNIDCYNTTTLNVGNSTAQTVNIACSNYIETVNIGSNASTGTTTINIGGQGDTVNINGTLNYIQSSDLQVLDKLITLNKGSVGSGTARGAGFQIRDNGNDNQSYISTNATGTGFQIKAPENATILDLQNNNFTTGLVKYNSTGGAITASAGAISDITNLQSTLDSKANLTGAGNTYFNINTYTSDVVFSNLSASSLLQLNSSNKVVSSNTLTNGITINANTTFPLQITNSTTRPIRMTPTASAQDMFIEFDTYNTTNTGFIGMPGTSSSFGAQGDMTLILNGLNNPSPSAFNVYQNNGNNISPAYRVPFKIDANANVIHNGNVDIMIGGTGVGPSSVSGQLAMGCNNSAYGWVQMFGANKHLLLNPVNGGGNVGIGPGVTTAPAYTCTINGSLGVTGNVTEYGAVSQYGSNTIYDPSNTTKYYQISPATSSIYVGDNNLTFDLQGNIRSFIFQGGNNIQLGSTGSTSQKVYYQGFSPMVPITNMNFNQYQYQFLDFGSSPLAVGGGSYAINGSAISYSSSSLKYGYVEILVECTVNTWYNIRYSINQYGSISINEYTHQVITGTPATNRWIYAKQNYLFVRGTLTDNTGGGTGVLSIQITTT